MGGHLCNQSINELYLSAVVVKAEKLMGLCQKKYKRNTKLQFTSTIAQINTEKEEEGGGGWR